MAKRLAGGGGDGLLTCVDQNQKHNRAREKRHCDLFLKAGNVKIDSPPILSRVKVNFSTPPTRGGGGEEREQEKRENSVFLFWLLNGGSAAIRALSGCRGRLSRMACCFVVLRRFTFSCLSASSAKNAAVVIKRQIVRRQVTSE